MTFFAQPPVLSILSGLIAVLIYHFCAHHPPVPTSQHENEVQAKKLAFTARTKAYLAVFVVVAVLVYGSFMVAHNSGGVKYTSPNPEIQTGGRPPF